VWVQPLSGNFVGGNGGRVRLISSGAASDRLFVGDWILLGRHFWFDVGNTDNRFAYFKWYRIVASDAEATRGALSTISTTGSDPYGSAAGSQVWSRDVVLEGPDFDFSPSVTLGGITVVTPTTGTLMTNVITVIDRTVDIP
jgi:hypothetical protein